MRSLIGQYHNLVLAPNTARVRAWRNRRTQCCLPDKARGKVCDLVWVTSRRKFNMWRWSLALAGPPKSAEKKAGGGGGGGGGGGVRLFKTVRLIGWIRYTLKYEKAYTYEIRFLGWLSGKDCIIYNYTFHARIWAHTHYKYETVKDPLHFHNG